MYPRTYVEAHRNQCHATENVEHDENDALLRLRLVRRERLLGDDITEADSAKRVWMQMQKMDGKKREKEKRGNVSWVELLQLGLIFRLLCSSSIVAIRCLLLRRVPTKGSDGRWGAGGSVRGRKEKRERRKRERRSSGRLIDHSPKCNEAKISTIQDGPPFPDVEH